MCKGLVLCARDDFVLQGARQVTEVIAVTGNAHNQIAVFLRICLRGSQGGRGDYIELNVMSVQAEVGADQMRHFVEPILAFQ